MELIDRDEAIKAINDVLMEDDQYKVWLMLSIINLKPVDAVPIDFIRKAIEAYGKNAEEYHKKGQYILGITAIERHVTLKLLIDDWKKENKNEFQSG